MDKKLIMPCMDIKDGRVVKGRKFEGIVDVADPVELARFYNYSGADNLIFYDIAASVNKKSIFISLLRRVKAVVSIPLIVGGGMKDIEDVKKIMDCGASQISINSGAIVNPEFIADASREFGSEVVMLSMDVKKVGNEYHVFSTAGTVDTGIEAIQWAKQATQNGAGSIVVNSIDADGMKDGYNIDLLQTFSDTINIPLIASGGAGKIEDFIEVFKIKNVRGALAASVFHYKDIEIKELKKALKASEIKAVDKEIAEENQ